VDETSAKNKAIFKKQVNYPKNPSEGNKEIKARLKWKPLE
jgi:hypothetical protein